MAIQYKHLTEQQFPDIHRTFMEAFADYYVDTSGLTRTVLYNRAVKNGVDFSASVGAFDGDRMVGITIVGLDDWRGAPGAYDIGTGIVPSHRGMGIAGEMFDFALPSLRSRGIRTFVLEVIQENSPAIRAYTAAGFTINREFDCYETPPDGLPAPPAAAGTMKIRAVERGRLDEFEPHLDWAPSWENSFNSLRRVPDELNLYGAFEGAECAGLLVYYPAINWISTLVVKRRFRRRGVATGLLVFLARRLRGVVPALKLVNVDRSDAAMTAFARKAGFARNVSQYEMQISL
jgi:ribosomal protein S18 acetylase RimI-like enzyme